MIKTIDILMLEPIYKEKIWGGSSLQIFYGDKLPSNKVGESWIVSAHDNGASSIINEPFKGMTLDKVYQEHRYLFANDTHPEFPLLVKFIDAEDDLSVQVHPDDEYAHKIGQPYGKEETWIILKAPLTHKIQIGHHANSTEHLQALIEKRQWSQLLKYAYIDKDYLVPVKPRTLHAILKGTMLLEIQQSSDTTYRVYDYDRIDDIGAKRPLHINESLQVIKTPDDSLSPYPIEAISINTRNVIYSGPYFSIERWDIIGNASFELEENYYLATMIDGTAKMNGHDLSLGCGVIITSYAKRVEINGTARIILAYTKRESK